MNKKLLIGFLLIFLFIPIVSYSQHSQQHNSNEIEKYIELKEMVENRIIIINQPTIDKMLKTFVYWLKINPSIYVCRIDKLDETIWIIYYSPYVCNAWGKV